MTVPNACVWVLQTTTETEMSDPEGAATIVAIVLIVLFFAWIASGDSGEDVEEEDSGSDGRQRRGLCESCGYEWRPRKSLAERETEPHCPDCGSTRVSIHYT